MKEILYYLIVGAICFAICALITSAIWNSDMPMWLKWMMLR